MAFKSIKVQPVLNMKHMSTSLQLVQRSWDKNISWNSIYKGSFAEIKEGFD